MCPVLFLKRCTDFIRGGVWGPYYVVHIADIVCFRGKLNSSKPSLFARSPPLLLGGVSAVMAH